MNTLEIRHHLHSIAEASGEEKNTSLFIIKQLEELHPTKIVKFSNGYHILAEFDSGKKGKNVIIRADMDAVRVDESKELSYHSVNQGVSHKCGHDGHSTILLRMAEKLHREPLQNGKVLLLFQGAEETGEGAQQILNDSLLDNYNIDFAYALHNIPGEENNAIICKSGSFTCSVISCEILLNGKTSHAAEPWNSVSPYPAAQKITEEILKQNCHDISSDNFCVATLIEFRVGEKAYGVAAGNGVLRFTIRTKIDSKLKEIKKLTEQLVNAETSKTDGLSSEISWIEYFAAANNSQEAAENVRKCAESLGLQYIRKPIPFFWGEDFGLFTQKYDGALFGVGSGKNRPPLHHPDFNFPDEIVETGAEMFYALAKRATGC